MDGINITVSESYKKMTRKTILSIFLFVIVYIFLFLFAIGLTMICAAAGIIVIAVKPMFFTLMIGFALFSIGLIVIIFLIKFLFKKHINDNSHLMEIKRTEQPELFEFINKTASEAGAKQPKKVYLSPDVNAFVFYNSSFWSLFFPVKKNLNLGIGLINSISMLELKAILGHEFGHFSQGTMAAGSYIYYVNSIIYNMLYDNDSFDNLLIKWGSINTYLSFSVKIAVKIIHGIQSALQRVYKYVNLNYLGLSREMEFNADEVAANIAGSEPLITSLLRLDLAEHSYNTVLNYYSDKIPDSIKTKNIFSQQNLILNFLGNENKFKIENNIPLVDTGHLNKYNKSKIVIKNQWSSHPSTEDRIDALKKLNIEKETDNFIPASSLFKNFDDIQKKITDKLFSYINYTGKPEFIDDGRFIEDFKGKYKENTFDIMFNDYYDNKSPINFDTEHFKLNEIKNNGSVNELFNDSKVELIYRSIGIENDLETLRYFQKEKVDIETFDYDGQKYLINECGQLIPKLELEFEEIKKRILHNDIEIYKYFYSLAVKNNSAEDFRKIYRRYSKMDKFFDINNEFHLQLVKECEFFTQDTKIELIPEKISNFKKTESVFKDKLKEILLDELFQPELDTEKSDLIKKYLSSNLIYFYNSEYITESTDLLFEVINTFNILYAAIFYRAKKDLLNYWVSLEKK